MISFTDCYQYNIGVCSSFIEMYCHDTTITVDLKNELLDSMILSIDPHKETGNRTRFRLRDFYMDPGQLKTLQNLFEVFDLKENGLRLTTRRLPYFHNLVRSGVCPPNTIAPADIILIPPVSIRDSLDSLTRKTFLHRDDRCSIEPALLKIEKALEFSSLLSSEISTAQEDIIVALIQPYMEDIVREMDNKEQLKTGIRRLGYIERTIVDPLIHE